MQRQRCRKMRRRPPDLRGGGNDSYLRPGRYVGAESAMNRNRTCRYRAEFCRAV